MHEHYNSLYWGNTGGRSSIRGIDKRVRLTNRWCRPYLRHNLYLTDDSKKKFDTPDVNRVDCGDFLFVRRKLTCFGIAIATDYDPMCGQ